MYRPFHSHQLSGQRMKQEFFTATTQHALWKKQDMKKMKLIETVEFVVKQHLAA